MNTLDEINRNVEKYQLKCKRGLHNNLIIFYNDNPIMNLIVEYELSKTTLKSLNDLSKDTKTITPNMRFGIITASKITAETIRIGDKIDFFRQAQKTDFPHIIHNTIIAEFKEMKLVSDINNIGGKKLELKALSC